MMGKVVKSKVSDLEEDTKKVYSKRLRKEMPGIVQEVVGNRRYFLRFEDGSEKDILSSQLTIVVVKSEVEEEIQLREVEMIPKVREKLG